MYVRIADPLLLKPAREMKIVLRKSNLGVKMSIVPVTVFGSGYQEF